MMETNRSTAKTDKLVIVLDDEKEEAEKDQAAAAGVEAQSNPPPKRIRKGAMMSISKPAAYHDKLKKNKKMLHEPAGVIFQKALQALEEKEKDLDTTSGSIDVFYPAGLLQFWVHSNGSAGLSSLKYVIHPFNQTDFYVAYFALCDGSDESILWLVDMTMHTTHSTSTFGVGRTYSWLFVSDADTVSMEIKPVLPDQNLPDVSRRTGRIGFTTSCHVGLNKCLKLAKSYCY